MCKFAASHSFIAERHDVPIKIWDIMIMSKPPSPSRDDFAKYLYEWEMVPKASQQLLSVLDRNSSQVARDLFPNSWRETS